MIWQDVVISIVSVVFLVSLSVQVYCGFKEKIGAIKLATALPTALGLFVITFTYFTLSLTFSAIVGFFTALLWSLLCVQRVMYNKKKRI